MNNINYQKELEKIIASQDRRPKLLLHCCCAPCSSHCLIYLMPHFDITCFYYNPNITDVYEYGKRLEELHRFIDILNGENANREDVSAIRVTDGRYESERFLAMVSEGGLEDCPEGGKRCEACFRMRLLETYEKACEGGFDYFTTTLTISPLKNAQLINDIGYALSGSGCETGDNKPQWLPSDFKKKDGYRHSIELSRQYGLYRQNYCGCVYSVNFS